MSTGRHRQWHQHLHTLFHAREESPSRSPLDTAVSLIHSFRLFCSSIVSLLLVFAKRHYSAVHNSLFACLPSGIVWSEPPSSWDDRWCLWSTFWRTPWLNGWFMTRFSSRVFFSNGSNLLLDLSQCSTMRAVSTCTRAFTLNKVQHVQTKSYQSIR